MHTQIASFVVPESNPYKRQGLLLYMARIAQRKSRQELAAEVGVCRDTVRNWENGTRVIDGVMLGRLATALEQDVKVFLS